MLTRSACSRALGVLLASACSACAAYPHLRFAPVVQETELHGPGGEVEARILVAWRGIDAHGSAPELRFRVRVENPGPTLFTLVPAEFELLDAGLTLLGNPRVEGLPTAVEPRRSVAFDLAFVPGADGLAPFDLAALTLRARLQGGRWSFSRIFQRVVLPIHDHDHCPGSWYFRFGAVWYG